MKKSCIPNIFTFMNLSFGILSIKSILHDNYLLSCIFILAAGIVDRYDGRVARYLNISSDLGKELDSLADLVSFGVAPSLLTYIIFNFSSIGKFGIIGIVLLLMFPICGSFRLARYNTTEFDGCFTGIPITVAGCFIAFYNMLTYNRDIPSIIAILLIITGSYLMVSKVKFKKV